MYDEYDEDEDYFNPSGFGMYSQRGDTAVATLVEKVTKKAKKKHWKAEKVTSYLRKKMEKLGELYGEVWDTAVRTAIIGRLERNTGFSLSIYF